MSKSVYSIVLDDNIVKMIDILSIKQNTSRSNLINRILAEHISHPTAETMLEDIYKSMDKFLAAHSSINMQMLGNSSIINMRSYLQYKYNPIIKYSVEIFEKENYNGQLKLSMRTQNKQLIEILNNFLNLWASLEQRYLNVSKNHIFLDSARYVRLFNTHNYTSYYDYGNTIAQYVNLLEKCIQEYFAYYPISQHTAQKNITQIFVNNINENLIKL